MDDITNEPLTQRADDQEQIVRGRLEVYENLTQLLIAYYEKLSQTDKDLKFLVVDGSDTIESVTKSIFNNLNRHEDSGSFGGAKL